MKGKVLVMALGAVLGVAFGARAETGFPLDSLRAEAAAGNPKAQYDLGYLYDIGYEELPVDSVIATSLYAKAAEGGLPAAQNLYGYRLYMGHGAEKDIREGIRWIEKAADQGDPRAWNNLGYLYSQGDEAARDYDRAVYWFEKAADKGVPTAMAQLGDLYRQGLGVEADTLRATYLYTQAIERGLRDAEDKLLAMNHPSYLQMNAQETLTLGQYYYTHRAPRLGVTLFEIAADKGSPQALALLGDAYSRGIGVPYSHDKSLYYFYEAARKGDPSAAFVIAELLDMYPDSLDILSDDIEKIPDAQYWYGRAADKGVSDAAEATRRLLD